MFIASRGHKSGKLRFCVSASHLLGANRSILLPHSFKAHRDHRKEEMKSTISLHLHISRLSPSAVVSTFKHFSATPSSLISAAICSMRTCLRSSHNYTRTCLRRAEIHSRVAKLSPDRHHYSYNTAPYLTYRSLTFLPLRACSGNVEQFSITGNLRARYRSFDRLRRMLTESDD